MPKSEEMARVIELLKEGKVQEAADLTNSLRKLAVEAEAAATGKIPEPPTPREIDVILRDILGQIAHDLGNKPALEALLHELDEADK